MAGVDETKRTTIEGTTYEVSLLPFGQSRPLFRVFAKASGGALTKLHGATLESFGAALEALLERYPEAELKELEEAFARHTMLHVSGGGRVLLSSVWEDHFRGAMWNYTQWLIFSIDANWGDFLDKLRNVAKERFGDLGAQKESSDSTSPKTSTGKSGDLSAMTASP